MASLTVILLFALTLTPLFLARIGVIKNKKLAMRINLIALIVLSIAVFAVGALAADNDVDTAEAQAVAPAREANPGYAMGLASAAFVTSVSCIAAGFAVSKSATAAIGALSEKPEIFGKALIFVALAEGVALYGMLVSIQILGKL